MKRTSYIGYLIEYEDGRWLNEKGELTNNPLEAEIHQLKAEAIWDMVTKWKVSFEEGYKVTEHEFVIN